MSWKMNEDEDDGDANEDEDEMTCGNEYPEVQRLTSCCYCCCCCVEREERGERRERGEEGDWEKGRWLKVRDANFDRVYNKSIGDSYAENMILNGKSVSNIFYIEMVSLLNEVFYVQLNGVCV